MEIDNFQISRLVKELKVVYAELNNCFSSRMSYEYIINYIILRIKQDIGLETNCTPLEIRGCEAVEERLDRILDKSRYNFKTAMEHNLLGKVYEDFLDINTRKNLGLYYTPEPIVNFIMDNTVKKADIVENPFVKVLDPSCGSGYFLIKAYDVLKQKFMDKIPELKNKYNDETYNVLINGKIYKIEGGKYWSNENIHYHIIKNCLYGADVDEFGTMFTQNSLKFKELSGNGPEPNIVLCNSLIKWERKSGKLKDFWNTKFNYIIGNPPWVSLSRKQGKKISKELSDYYKENYTGNSYLPNLYEYFLERSLELIDKEGYIGLLIPDRFAKNRQFAGFRKHILQEYNIRNILFGVKLNNIAADSMAIVIEQNFKRQNKIKFSNLGGTSFTTSQRDILNTSDFQFSSWSSEHTGIFKSINSNSKALKDAALTFTGFIGINKDITDERTGEMQLPVIKGVNIGRYKIKSNKYYNLSPENIIGGTKNIDRLMTIDKIVVRKTGKTLVAALDREGYAIEQTLYGIIPVNSEFRLKYILAVLNSKLMEWYYLNFLVTNVNSAPQLKKFNLDEVPLKCCSIEKQLYIEELVDKIENSSGLEYDTLQKKIDKEIFDIYCIKKDPHGQHVERI